MKFARGSRDDSELPTQSSLGKTGRQVKAHLTTYRACDDRLIAYIDLAAQNVVNNVL